MKWIKILVGLALFCLLFLGGFFAISYFLLLPFEHREDHNGVGWAKFARSIEKEIEQSGFTSDDFGHYEGTVMTGTLRSGNKSIELEWLQRGNYLDARDMNTLKQVRIQKVNGKTIKCLDRENHSHPATILSRNLPSETGTLDFSSISEILAGHDKLAKIFLSYPETKYRVMDGKVLDTPSWLFIRPIHNSCHTPKHDVQELVCRVE